MKAWLFLWIGVFASLSGTKRVEPGALGAVTPESAKDSVVRGLMIDTLRLGMDSGATATLENVQAQLGVARVHSPTHHDDVAWTCYRIPTDNGSVYVKLKGNYYRTVPPYRLGGFQLSTSLPRDLAATTCPVAPRFHSIGTSNGLYLGMPISGLLAIMHSPKSHVGERYNFEYVRLVSVAGEEPYNIVAALDVEARNGLVIYLSAEYAETT